MRDEYHLCAIRPCFVKLMSFIPFSNIHCWSQTEKQMECIYCTKVGHITWYCSNMPLSSCLIFKLPALIPINCSIPHSRSFLNSSFILHFNAHQYKLSIPAYLLFISKYLGTCITAFLVFPCQSIRMVIASFQRKRIQ